MKILGHLHFITVQRYAKFKPDVGVGDTVPRVRSMQMTKRALESQNRTYPIFPLMTLTTFSTYREVVVWGVTRWGLPPMMVLSLFYQQSWALVRYLNDEAGPVRSRQCLRMLGAVLGSGAGSNVRLDGPLFARAFQLNSKADWRTLDSEFKSYVNEDVMGMNLQPFDYRPPVLGAWR